MGNVNNYLIFNLLQQVLEELLPYSHLEDKILYHAVSKITLNYNESQVRAA